MQIVPELYIAEEFYNKRDRRRVKKGACFTVATASLASASKAKTIACIGHFFSGAVAAYSATALALPVTLKIVYDYIEQGRYECFELSRDLSQLPLTLEAVDLLLQGHARGNIGPWIVMSAEDLHSTQRILKKVVIDAYKDREELPYFNPTKERCYCLEKGGTIFPVPDLTLLELENTLKNGLNYRGLIVKYARYLLEEILVNESHDSKIQISLYDYNLGLSQIVAACHELRHLS